MIKILLTSALLILCSCASRQSPVFHINLSGYNADTSNINAVDLAMAEAFNMVGVRSPKDWFTSVELHQGPYFLLSISSTKYSGTETSELGQTFIQNVWFPCLLDSHSALLHEFVHMALFVKNGDEDNGHTTPVWDLVDSHRARLEARYCR